MVSVIIPTYGGGECIEKVINSILSQTYQNIEIIVVDDNGFESERQIKTASQIEKYIRDGAIQYYALQYNQGGSAARNIGARLSKGDFLMFLDDDDTVSADKIEKQVYALENAGREYGIAYCSSRIYSGETLSNTIVATANGDILYGYLMGKVYMGTGTALLTRNAWESLGGYDESFIRHQDWEFFSRVLNKYYAIAVPEVYFNRYITNRNTPQRIDLLEEYADKYIDFLQNYGFRLPERKIRKVILRNNSRVLLAYIHSKRIKDALRVFKKYGHLFSSFFSVMAFSLSVCLDKLCGKKT